jgi:outer membrane lipoprotein-sorting protein
MEGGIMKLLFLLGLVTLKGDTVAREIMLKVHNRPTFRDMHSLMVMTLRDPKGNVRVREMEAWSKTDEKTGETKLLLKFLKPADIRGTAFLIHEHKNRDDDMWFYLPALRRVKRLAASGKSGSFMGSDFSNYDIGGGEFEDWNYRLLREEKIDGELCWVIEATPKGPDVEKKSGYSKQLKWVSQRTYIVLRTDHYDRTGALFKRTTVDSVSNIEGIWFEKVMRSRNLDSGHETVIEFKDVEVNRGLGDDIFTVRSLKR